MLVNTDFDFIFLGAGCASLSLLLRIISSEQFADKKILLIDKESKTANDRTWCFWEKENGFFEDIVFSKWDTISFLSDDFSEDMNIAPYQYKMIRGIDFYQYCFERIAKLDNIETLYGQVEKWSIENDELIIEVSGNNYLVSNDVVFNYMYQ
jgi:lycopene beta-cyclase